MTEPLPATDHATRTWVDKAVGWSLLLGLTSVPLAFVWVFFSDVVVDYDSGGDIWTGGLILVSLVPPAAVALAHVSYAAPGATWRSPLRIVALIVGYATTFVMLGSWLLLLSLGASGMD